MNKQEIFEIIKRNILNILPELNPEQICIDKQLRDLGANSIDRVEIILASMEEAGIQMPLSDLAQAKNISSLIDVLVANTQ